MKFVSFRKWMLLAAVAMPLVARADAPLATEDFESGDKVMTDVPDRSLEIFLRDLNDRMDWDEACHNGNPGPDAAYLLGWVEKTATEMKRRGYTFDDEGVWQRPAGK